MDKELQVQDKATLGGAGLTPPVSEKDFRDDVTNIFLHYVRTIAWMADAQTAWAITKAPELNYAGDLLNPDLKADDLGLHYEHIRETELAKAMQRMYDFAYFGLLDLSADGFNDESIHTWITAIVVDAASGAVSAEWNAYGLDTDRCAARCAQVAETANARAILEGGESFSSAFRWGGKDNLVEDGVLTVRQVSLLAGMEEMSIRAAANPNRANPLQPMKTESGTRFDIQVVKNWLVSKKRYVTIRKRWSDGEMNLHKKRFSSIAEVDMGLNARYRMFCNEKGVEVMAPVISALGIKTGNTTFGVHLSLEEADLVDDKKVRGLARALELPDELLVLRIKEVVAAENLRSIEQAIKVLEAG